MNLSSTNIQQNMEDVKKILTDNEKQELRKKQKRVNVCFVAKNMNYMYYLVVKL